MMVILPYAEINNKNLIIISGLNFMMVILPYSGLNNNNLIIISGLKFMMVILPYSGLNISMGLILPEKGTDTAQIMVIYIYYIAFSLCLFVSNKR